MKVLTSFIVIAVLLIAVVFGYSYFNNPDMPAKERVSAVGFAVANPMSSKAWRGLACPHRSVVSDLVTQSLAPKLCGTDNDGGAAERAERFRTEGPVSCWALFDALAEKNKVRFAGVIAGSEKPGAAVNDVCQRAKALIDK